MLKKLMLLGFGLTGGLFLAVLFAATPSAASAHDVAGSHHSVARNTQVSYTQRAQSYTHWSRSATLHYTVGNINSQAQNVTVTAHTQVNYIAWTQSYFHYSQHITVHTWYSNHHQVVHQMQNTTVSYTAWTQSYAHLSASADVHYTYWMPGKSGHRGKKVSVTLNARVSYTTWTKTYAHYTASTQTV